MFKISDNISKNICILSYELCELTKDVYDIDFEGFWLPSGESIISFVMLIKCWQMVSFKLSEMLQMKYSASWYYFPFDRPTDNAQPTKLDAHPYPKSYSQSSS